jgi:hypothetical protein
LSKLLLAAFIGLATPAAAWAASGGGHGVPPHSFGAPAHAQAFAGHRLPGFGGLGGSGAYTTLLSGTYESAPEDMGPGLLPPPPFCYGMPPIAPPERCVRPLLIHLTPSHPAKNLPRVVYGTPFNCAG